jgi:hypothetical protein
MKHSTTTTKHNALRKPQSRSGRFRSTLSTPTLRTSGGGVIVLGIEEDDQARAKGYLAVDTRQSPV